MRIEARRADLTAIAPWRARYLAEMAAQVRYDAVHRRGWSDVYVVRLDGVDVGYGAIKGFEHLADRDTLFELYVDPPVRPHAVPLAGAVLAAAGADRVQCQTNDAGLCGVFRQLATGVEVEAILFADHHQPALAVPGAIARPRRDNDVIFEHTAEPVGDFVVEYDGQIVATGGALTHYNPPYADLYMEVRPDVRRCGFGALVLQAVKAGCYAKGLVPAARTGVTNQASQATLRRAGLRECGFVLTGRVVS
ncbi:MAG TPA: GNAT family N-acetyltransferase [Vicinamibacterales bacterium]|nr:GNAT family N-acetyltransferase [Vicinamibacterales bacterium]